MPIAQAPNIYNNEFTPMVTRFTDSTKWHRILCLFGYEFLAMDWDKKEQEMIVYETFKYSYGKVNLLSAHKENRFYMAYSETSNKLIELHREFREQ